MNNKIIFKRYNKPDLELDSFDIRNKVNLNIRSCMFTTYGRYNYNYISAYLPGEILAKCKRGTKIEDPVLYMLGLITSSQYHWPNNVLVPVQFDYTSSALSVVPDVYGPFQFLNEQQNNIQKI